MTFCLTGTLQRPRKEVQQSIKSAGGKVVGSVSSQLSVLLAGEKAGSKLAKAESLGIQVWSEQQLEQALTMTSKSESLEEELLEPVKPKKNGNKQPSLLDF